MKPFKHSSGRWAVMIPAKLSDTGIREMRYYSSEAKAREDIKGFKQEKREHGRSGVTSEERHWINVARNELGDLSILPEVIRHWKRTGEKLNQIEIKDAVKEFLDSAEKDYPNRRTLNDIKERLEKFKTAFSARLVHEVSTTEIEKYLESYPSGWHRWSEHKRLKPFFKVARRRRWVASDPMEELPTPKTPTPERQIYTVEQFSNLLWFSELMYESILPYVVLCGFCFLRTAELVRMYANEKVLRWEHVLWDDGLIHVPHGVAKSTRRESGDERYIPLNDAAKLWLQPIRKESGDCVPHSASKFGELWRKMTDKAKVPRIDNGLRHSAISYSLAAYPENGVALTSQWAGNSEKTIRKHYRRLLKPEQGKAWFAVEHV
jgi:site-specific recombinase XerD